MSPRRPPRRSPSAAAGFQKARDTIHERNHLRLGMGPMTFRGQYVWIGTITG